MKTKKKFGMRRHIGITAAATLIALGATACEEAYWGDGNKKIHDEFLANFDTNIQDGKVNVVNQYARSDNDNCLNDGKGIDELKILFVSDAYSGDGNRFVIMCSEWSDGDKTYYLTNATDCNTVDNGSYVNGLSCLTLKDAEGNPPLDKDNNNVYQLCGLGNSTGRFVCKDIAYYCYSDTDKEYKKCDISNDLEKVLPDAFKASFNYRTCPKDYTFSSSWYLESSDHKMRNVCVKSVCGDKPVDLNSDNENCGGCGNKCENTTCVNGKCDIVKGNEGLVLCDGKYINPNTSTEYCGAKGNCSVKNEFNDPNYAGEKCPENRKFCTNGRCNVECVSGQIVCDEQCVNPLTDIAYCGARGKCNKDASDDKDYKGVACAEGYVCSDGECGLTCATGQIKCGSKCIDPLENKTYCGAKGTCEGDDEKQDNFKGKICEEGSVCSEGKCSVTCVSGQIVCNGKCIDPKADNTYCGAKGGCNNDSIDSEDYKGATCTNGRVCSNGSCDLTCETGKIICNNKCVDPKADNTYCGAKGTCNNDSIDSNDYKGATCTNGRVCSNGFCALTCEIGKIICDNKCVDPKTDNTYCGAKAGCTGATECRGVTPLCSGGNCVSTCIGNQIVCGGRCVDPSSDNSYCGAKGACNNVSAGSNDYRGATCKDGRVCSNGSCDLTCETGKIICNNKCVDPKADNTYCGAKGTCNNDSIDSNDYKGATCTNGRVCSNGFCALTCEIGKIICDNKCVDPKTDNTYCGAKAGCTGATECRGVTPLCSGGNCVSTCIGNQIVCGGRCVDPSSDNSYCGAKGACNNVSASSNDYRGATCKDGRVCSNGSCDLTCETGKIICDNKCVDPKTDNSYCGAKGECSNTSTSSNDYKGATCTNGRVCSNGFCALTCEIGKIICDNKCVDPKTDNTYCGAKAGCTGATECRGVTPLCSGGNCVSTCIGNQIVCGGRCVDPSSDNSYCGAKGACNNVSASSNDYRGATCTNGRVCSNGSCDLTCETGKIICNNKCVDPKTDNAYCGAKGKCNSASDSDANYRGKACTNGTKCSEGRCVVTCTSNQIVCGEQCVEPSSSKTNCGAKGKCNNPNVNSQDYQGALCDGDQVCAGGECVKNSCNSAKPCREIQNGVNQCISGECKLSCNSGYVLNVEQNSCTMISDSVCGYSNGAPLNCTADKRNKHCDKNTLQCVECLVQEHCVSETNNASIVDCTAEKVCKIYQCDDGFVLHNNTCVPTVERCGTSAKDCTKIPNVLNADSVSCDNGFCVVTSCKPDSNTHVYNPSNGHGMCEENTTENCGSHGNKCGVEDGTGQVAICEASTSTTSAQCKYSCAEGFTDCSSASTSSETENASLICLKKDWRKGDLTKDECKSCVNGGCKTGETCKRTGTSGNHSYSCE